MLLLLCLKARIEGALPDLEGSGKRISGKLGLFLMKAAKAFLSTVIQFIYLHE